MTMPPKGPVRPAPVVVKISRGSVTTRVPGKGMVRPATTIASGISVTSPSRLSQVVDAVRETGGQGVAVDEASIIGWQKRLAMSEGIFGEATSAVAFAGLERLIADGVIASDDRVVVPVTGSGLKEPLPQ